MTDERKNEIWAMLPEDYREFAQTFHRQWKGNTAFINECCVIEALFGSHNLTAQAEEKPKEPRFNIGEKVRINCYSNDEVWDAVMHNKIVTIQDYYVKDGVNMYVLKEGCRDFGEHCLEPYTEPKEEETGEEREKSKKSPINYSQYRLDLTKEITVALINNTDENTPYGNILPYGAVKMANEIVKRLKETEP